MQDDSALNRIQASIRLQIHELEQMASQLEPVLNDIVELILTQKGRVIFCGLGKSGHIAKKVSATMSSTGTPSMFVHPSESLHGDLGMVTPTDLFIFISKGGENPEMNLMLPSLKQIGVKMVAVTCQPESSLARFCDYVISMGPLKEICPLKLAPTTSTTATLVLLDALAMELMRRRNFKEKDYALFHPGGQLGRRLLFTVSDLMSPIEVTPKVKPDLSPKAMLHAITEGCMGAVLVVDQGKFLGLITDHDIRKCLEKEADFFKGSLLEIMNDDPLTCTRQDNAYDVLLRMRKKEKPITLMPVVEEGQALGMIRLETMVQQGLV